eukprot:Skav221706  [mRNA]  locus=scaffold542:16470:17113:- [translate_table: standard]
MTNGENGLAVLRWWRCLVVLLPLDASSFTTANPAARKEDGDSPQRTAQQMLSASQLQSLAHGLFPPDEGTTGSKYRQILKNKMREQLAEVKRTQI